MALRDLAALLNGPQTIGRGAGFWSAGGAGGGSGRDLSAVRESLRHRQHGVFRCLGLHGAGARAALGLWRHAQLWTDGVFWLGRLRVRRHGDQLRRCPLLPAAGADLRAGDRHGVCGPARLLHDLRRDQRRVRRYRHAVRDPGLRNVHEPDRRTRVAHRPSAAERLQRDDAYPLAVDRLVRRSSHQV